MATNARMEVARRIEKRFRENGIETISQLHRSSQTNLSAQTYYRLFDPDFRGHISMPVIIEIAYNAGCKKSEIIEMLKMLGDRFWCRLIEPESDMTEREAAVLSVVRKITAVDTDMWDSLTHNLGLLAKAAGVVCTRELNVLHEAR